MDKVRIKLSGGPGTGKTQLFEVMQEYLSDYYKAQKRHYSYECMAYWTPSREAVTYQNGEMDLLLYTIQDGPANGVLEVEVWAEKPTVRLEIQKYVAKLLSEECLYVKVLSDGTTLYVDEFHLVILTATGKEGSNG